MKFPRVQLPVLCARKKCGAIAFKVPDAKRVVIECTKCQKFARGEDEEAALKIWRGK